MSIPCPSTEDPSVERRYFGELALLYDAPRAASVKAVGRVKLWALDRTTFKSILQQSDDIKMMLYSKFVQSIHLFRDLKLSQVNALCSSLVAQDFDDGDTVVNSRRLAIPARGGQAVTWLIAELPSRSAAADLLRTIWTFRLFEFEDGVNECFLKEAYDSIHCDEYVYWDGSYDDSSWYGQSGPAECDMTYAEYGNTEGSHKHGTPGGSYGIGGRSFTVSAGCAIKIVFRPWQLHTMHVRLRNAYRNRSQQHLPTPPSCPQRRTTDLEVEPGEQEPHHGLGLGLGPRVLHVEGGERPLRRLRRRLR